MLARSRWGALGALAVALASCGEPAAPRRPVLLTASDLAALSLQPVPPATIVTGYGLPDGMRLDRIVKADSAKSASLVKRETFTEEYRSAYLTTEVWAGFDEVWIQPVYVAVTGYDEKGVPRRAKGVSQAWRPIFGVGADSAFYSPYWRTVYFRIGDQDVDSFLSVRDVLSRGSDFRAAEGHVMVLAPPTVGVPARLVLPKNGEQPVGGPERGTGVLDGVDAPFLDFGAGSFTWNDDLVVEEAPIFVWVVRDPKGELHQLDIPTVAGTGPLYASGPPKLLGTQPKYGSYWRLYTVELPAGARVFAPEQFKAELQAGMDALGVGYLYQLDYAAEIVASEATSLDEFAGRVLTNPDCVDDLNRIDPTNFTEANRSMACQYVDSQPKIEAVVSSDAIKRTDILVTCPFITYRDVPVIPVPPMPAPVQP